MKMRYLVNSSMINLVNKRKRLAQLLLNYLTTFGFATSIFIHSGIAHASSPTNQPIQPAPTQSTSLSGPVSYADAVAIAAPAVVSIKTTKQIPIEINPLMQDPFWQYFFGEQGMGEPQPQDQNDNQNRPKTETLKEIQQGLGSGVIVNDKGYVLTNNHVIREADTVIVSLYDGRQAEAKVIGSDPDTDLAVLQIKLDKLPVIKMGSSDKIRVGDVVLAIGNPFGFDKTVTHGIISATNRNNPEFNFLQGLLQTDAAINPGNSGGALVDTYGRLIGINTVIYSRSGGSQGIGFAIPIDKATDIMNKLIETGYVSRGYMGVSLQGLNKEIRDYIGYKEGDGVYVRAVVRGSPAQKAGILPGDVIVKINNTSLTDERMAVRFVANLVPGKSYPIEIYRKGEFISFTVAIEERKNASGPNRPGQENKSGMKP